MPAATNRRLCVTEVSAPIQKCKIFFLMIHFLLLRRRSHVLCELQHKLHSCERGARLCVRRICVKHEKDLGQEKCSFLAITSLFAKSLKTRVKKNRWMESSRLIRSHDAMYGVNREWTWGAVFSRSAVVWEVWLVNEPSSWAYGKSHDFYFALKFVFRGSVHDLLRWTDIEVTSCGVSRKSTNNSRFLLFSTLDETVFRRSKSKLLETLVTSLDGARCQVLVTLHLCFLCGN